jgi:signal transduction histidine kinase
LDGIDHEWIFTDASRRYIHYTYLDPGEYTFRVKGSNNFGYWNQEGIKVNILITPPWWDTWWSRTLAGLLIIGILGIIYRTRVSHLQKLATTQKEFSQKLIESQEEGKKRIASALHDSHGQNLLIISNELQRIRETDFVEAEKLSPLLDTVIESIDEIREISYNLHPHQLDSLGLKKAIESMINRLNHNSNIKFYSQI